MHKEKIKQTTQTTYERTKMSDVTDKNFKPAIVNMFKELKETVLKEIKVDMMTMSHQTENTNKEI